MFMMLIDTCVWLDLAKDPKQRPVLDVVEEMVRLGLLTVIVPRVVLDEFHRNRKRIEKDSAKNLSAHFRLVRDAVEAISGDKRKTKLVLSHLDDVNHKMPIVGGAAAATLDRIDNLLAASLIIETSDTVKLRAAQRALEKRAPFHRDKNAMADAILIETYDECVLRRAGARVRFAFVTHNKSEFSAPDGNHKMPHPDFAKTFSRIKSLYFINLAEALRRVEPSLVTDIMLEQSWTLDPRSLAEMLDAQDFLFHQVWYNRHLNLRSDVEEGRTTIVDKEVYPKSPGAPETVQRDIWKGALKAAKRVERRYGVDKLLPSDDFEWGMINGKLSALRWVLGDEWDMLDS